MWFQECNCLQRRAGTGVSQEHSQFDMQMGQFCRHSYSQQTGKGLVQAAGINVVSKQARDNKGSRQRQHCTGVVLIWNTVAGCTGSGKTVLKWW